MIKSVLIPHAVADICYLQEALYWVAFGRFPIAWGSQYDEDGRLDDEHVWGLEPNYDVDLISENECVFAGLPISPAWEAVRDFYHYTPSIELEKWISRGWGALDKQQQQQQLDEAITYEKRLADWEKSCGSVVDLHSAKLFIALREGKINATGKRLSKELLSRLIADGHRRQDRKALEQQSTEYSEDTYEYARGPDWDNMEREPVPKHFWNSKTVNWGHSYAEGGEFGFGLIFVDTAQLLDVFPIREPSDLSRIYKVADFFIFLGGEEAAAPRSNRRGGRPPFEWEEFHVEIARLARDGRLPAKQEALISEMQQWCRAKWGREVGRSTVLQKIKPYYDAFFRQSEK